MKFFKTFFKSIDVAFSMYSKIPMPRFNWASEDMKYHLCFFPWVGAVIGLLEYLLWLLKLKTDMDNVLYCTLSVALPFLITGGFHADGFLDTMDALHSYQDKDRKLEILKDPHVGAFAIISFAVYILLALGFTSLMDIKEEAVAVCFSFFISRALSGLSVTWFKKAKKEGMVYTSSSTESPMAVTVALIIQLALSVFLLVYLCRHNIIYSLVVILCEAMSFIYYYFMSKKQFGGITGDLSGFFVCISELCSLIGAASLCFIMERI